MGPCVAILGWNTAREWWLGGGEGKAAGRCTGVTTADPGEGGEGGSTGGWSIVREWWLAGSAEWVGDRKGRGRVQCSG